MNRDQMLSFGVFKPVGHVVIALPSEDRARQAFSALAAIGIPIEEMLNLTDQEMLEGATTDLARAGLGAGIGQDVNLVRAHRELARHGYHWLIVRARSRDRAIEIARLGERHDAARAQFYGRLLIEELVAPVEQIGQRNESPEFGLDAETRSHTEAERARQHG